MIRDVWSCQEEKWSKAKLISQGAAAVAALRAAEGGGRRRWSPDLQVLRVTTQPSFKERWASWRMSLDPCPLGTKRSGADQSLAEYRLLSFEEDAREEHHKKRENTTGQKYNGFQNTQMGHRQSRQNQDDWFSSFLQCCPPSCSLQDTNQRGAQRVSFFSCWSYFLFLKANVRVQRGVNSLKPLASIRRTSVFISCTSRLKNIQPVLTPHSENTAHMSTSDVSVVCRSVACWHYLLETELKWWESNMF